jgi:hypothetical protein
MKLLATIATLLALALAAAGCTIQLPTEKQEVADLRPQLSFTLADPADKPGIYRVNVDGLDMGSVEKYLSGQNGLKVLSGTHVVKVEGRGRVVVEERLYLGDGATRNIVIPRP